MIVQWLLLCLRSISDHNMDVYEHHSMFQCMCASKGHVGLTISSCACRICTILYGNQNASVHCQFYWRKQTPHRMPLMCSVMGNTVPIWRAELETLTTYCWAFKVLYPERMGKVSINSFSQPLFLSTVVGVLEPFPTGIGREPFLLWSTAVLTPTQPCHTDRQNISLAKMQQSCCGKKYFWAK